MDEENVNSTGIALFATKDARELLRNKFVLIVGDSNMRALYKDLVQLLTENELISFNALRKRGEPSFKGDDLFQSSGMTRGRNYRESRRISIGDVQVEYHFITKCFSTQMEDLLNGFAADEGRSKAPDVLIINSCIWDISRWGPCGVDLYKDNLRKLFEAFKSRLSETLIIWSSAFPVSPDSIKGGLLTKEVEHMQRWLCFEIVVANAYVRNMARWYKFEYVDVHASLMCDLTMRMPDGVHFNACAMRLITNQVLSRVSRKWGKPLPRDYESLMKAGKSRRVEEVADAPFIGIKAPVKGENECFAGCFEPVEAVAATEYHRNERPNGDKIRSYNHRVSGDGGSVNNRKKRRKGRRNRRSHNRDKRCHRRGNDGNYASQRTPFLPFQNSPPRVNRAASSDTIPFHCDDQPGMWYQQRTRYEDYHHSPYAYNSYFDNNNNRKRKNSDGDSDGEPLSKKMK